MTAQLPFGPLPGAPAVETQRYFSPPYTGPVEPPLTTSLLDRNEELETALHIAETYAEIRAGVAMRALQQVAALQELLEATMRERDLANLRVTDLETVLRQREETISRLVRSNDEFEPDLTNPGSLSAGYIAGYVPDTDVCDPEDFEHEQLTPRQQIAALAEESGPRVSARGGW